MQVCIPTKDLYFIKDIANDFKRDRLVAIYHPTEDPSTLYSRDLKDFDDPSIFTEIGWKGQAIKVDRVYESFAVEEDGISLRRMWPVRFSSTGSLLIPDDRVQEYEWFFDRLAFLLLIKNKYPLQLTETKSIKVTVRESDLVLDTLGFEFTEAQESMLTNSFLKAFYQLIDGNEAPYISLFSEVETKSLRYSGDIIRLAIMSLEKGTVYLNEYVSKSPSEIVKRLTGLKDSEIDTTEDRNTIALLSYIANAVKRIAENAIDAEETAEYSSLTSLYAVIKKRREAQLT